MSRAFGVTLIVANLACFGWNLYGIHKLPEWSETLTLAAAFNIFMAAVIAGVWDWSRR